VKFLNTPCRLHGGGELPPALVNVAVDGITADLYWKAYPSPVQLGQGVEFRGRVWLVVVVREWDDTSIPATQLAVSLCNCEGVLIRRETVVTPYGLDVQPVGDPIPFLGVWRIMRSTEKPGELTVQAELMPVDAWAWPGGVHDLIRLPDGTEWEQYGVTTSDQSALAMIRSGAPVVKFRQVPAVPDHG
jgi:hypothetical protein